MSNKTYIIIPCYNEVESVLRQTVQELLDLRYEPIMVDDGSQIPLREMLSDMPLHILRHPINLGQGAALQTGMEYAKRLGAEHVLHFDADGQHRAEDIERFITTLDEGYDVVLGSRFLRHEDSGSLPTRKRLLLQAARLVNLIFTGVWLTDAHNGFRALNRKALHAIDLQENRMAHATEILSQIRHAKLKIKEIPTLINYSEYSLRKGQKISNSLNIILDLILRKLL
ncbi:MAG: glycosyltransferase family 2 protein [Oligosphaeraceae bacterium]|nr:glycosyltransferase family 2 protein [Oligosphaeraceae bacterium]